MKMPKYTAEQQAAIDAKGKTIVSASAGSGKTTVMIEKLLGILKGGADVSSILAVTYTKKAAAQMREKLRKKIIEALCDPDLPQSTREHLKKQLSGVAVSDVSTIHSFCSRLIKTHF
jgi:ATP-dependent helicase/nuclease subunit A